MASLTAVRRVEDAAWGSGSIRRRRFTSATASLLTVAALHGPEPRTEVGVSGGGGEYWYVPACSSTLHRASFWEGQAYLRHRREHFSASLEGSFMQARDTAEEPAPPPGASPAPQEMTVGRTKTKIGAVLAGRVGYHWRYFGMEGGPALLVLNSEATAAPSFRLWGGVPETFYGWASFLAEDVAAPSRLMGVGVGRATDSLRLSLGVAPSAMLEVPTGVADVSFRLPEGVWIGAGLQVGPPDRGRTWTALVRAAFEL